MQADILAKHPRSGDRLRYTVARYTAFQLVLGFLAGVVVLAALLGLFYWLTDAGSRHSYWFWWREAGLMLVGFQTQTTEASEHGLRAVVQAVASVLGLVVPALALGTVVFKSLVSDRIYATRRNLSVVPRENVLLQPSDDATTHWLTFRLYSSTKLQVVDIAFEAYARVRGTSPTNVPTVTNVQLPLAKANWPISLTHVPVHGLRAAPQGRPRVERRRPAAPAPSPQPRRQPLRGRGRLRPPTARERAGAAARHRLRRVALVRQQHRAELRALRRGDGRVPAAPQDLEGLEEVEGMGQVR